MYLIDPAAHTRRAFLRRSGQLAMAGTALPFALNLAAMGEAAAQAAPGDDYKACLLYTSPSPRDLSTSRMPSSA